jgi:hypothetical protein
LDFCASSPTSHPESVQDSTEGVIELSPEASITSGPSSKTVAAKLFVVPKSMPIIRSILNLVLLAKFK